MGQKSRPLNKLYPENVVYLDYGEVRDLDFVHDEAQKHVKGNYTIILDEPYKLNRDVLSTLVVKINNDLDDDLVIAMFAKGVTTFQISEMFESIYGFEISEGMVSDITDKMMPQIEDWQNRPLSAVYPIVFVDAIHFSVRNDGIVSKLAAYIVLGINEDGMKEVLSIEIGENESSKYWLSVLNSLKNRGVQDILILCSKGCCENSKGILFE